MQKFKALEYFFVKGRGHVFIVENPHECDDFKHLENQTVQIDTEIDFEEPMASNKYTILKVETFSHTKRNPYIAGERIAILVEES